MTLEKIQLADRLISDDLRVTIRELSEAMGISNESVREILYEHLGVRKLTARWIPKLLTADMKRVRVNTCRDLLAMHDATGADCLSRIETGDESWFLFYAPESKQQSMAWTKVGEAPPTKVRSAPSAAKRMATVFWDQEGILLLKWLPEGSTINSKYY